MNIDAANLDRVRTYIERNPARRPRQHDDFVRNPPSYSKIVI